MIQGTKPGAGQAVRFFYEWLEAGLSLLFPERCQICEQGKAGVAEGYVCGRCREGPGGVRFIQRPICERCGLPYPGEVSGEFVCGNCYGVELGFEWARSAVVASPLVLDVVHRYKYRRALWFEPFLAELLLRQIREVGLRKAEWEWIVPVPLHWHRERERQFNQSVRLGGRLSRETGIPMRTDLLERREMVMVQASLSRSERMENVKDAFELRAGRRLQGERLLLFDDVLTTGATTSACAATLRKKGAGKVCVWTVARGTWKL